MMSKRSNHIPTLMTIEMAQAQKKLVRMRRNHSIAGIRMLQSISAQKAHQYCPVAAPTDM